MRHKTLTQHAPFCIGAMAKKGTLSQDFVMHVIPPWGRGVAVEARKGLSKAAAVHGAG